LDNKVKIIEKNEYETILLGKKNSIDNTNSIMGYLKKNFPDYKFTLNLQLANFKIIITGKSVIKDDILFKILEQLERNFKDNQIKWDGGNFVYLIQVETKLTKEDLQKHLGSRSIQIVPSPVTAARSPSPGR